jgi:rhamnosyltransferase
MSSISSAAAVAAIVVVLYETDPQAAVLKAHRSAGDRFFVVLIDNTPGRNQSHTPVGLGSNMAYLPLGDNLGIATALNRGIAHAESLGHEKIFTFDQDSHYDARLLDALLNRFDALRPLHAAGLALGPLPRHRDSGVSYLRRRDRLRLQVRNLLGLATDVLPVAELITSGLLSDRATYRHAGFYREDLFIDFVDHEWCWRLRRQGGVCLVDVQVSLPHMVGEGEVPFTMGMKRGSPRRLFFLFRNGIYLAFSGAMPVYDAIKFLLLIPAKLLVFGLFFPDRMVRLRHAWQGLITGLRWSMHPKGC